MTSLEFMQGPGTSPFPPTGIYYRLAHKCLVPRFFAYGSEWSVGQIKGRPLNVQAKGQLWPTRAFYAECAQVRAGRQSRNADFILIAAKRRYHHPLNPLNILNLFLHNPFTQPAAPAATLFLICGVSRHRNPRGQRPRQT